MPTSQFTIYTSQDPYGPGLANGLTGSLIPILNACLVDGYGTGSYYKAPAGWSKPLADVAGNFPMSVLACYKQGSGSMMTLFVNDSPGFAGGVYVTAMVWATGWESMSSLTSSLGSIFTGSNNISASNSAGFGVGQFPTPAQLLTYGHVTWRKSDVNTSVTRPWIIAADASTMYMWIKPSVGASADKYGHFAFGDCYSYAGPNDLWKCFIYGKITDALTADSQNNNIDYTHLISSPHYTPAASTGITNALFGHFIARSAFGGGSSTAFTRRGDASVSISGWNNGNPFGCSIDGYIQTPNIDNFLYMRPLEIVEPSATPVIRGSFRGLYQVGHPATNFTDGQIISGSGDYSGKIFMIIKWAPDFSFWALEISPTVETN
jgi:hypothetical protein